MNTVILKKCIKDQNQTESMNSQAFKVLEMKRQKRKSKPPDFD